MRSEQLGKTLNGFARSGSLPSDLYSELGGLCQGMQATEKELAAITAFMEERDGGG